MKKVLFATTALVASAGIAAADDNMNLSLGGWAEAGIVGGSGVDIEFFQDIDVDFDFSATTNTGLTFGASVDLDEAGGGLATEDDDQGTTVFISGDFGRLTMGDTDGAMDWALAEGNSYNNPGSIADEETGHAGYRGSYLDGAGDGQIVRYNHAVSDFSFALSIEQDDVPNDTRGRVSGGDGSAGVAVGGKYSFNGLAVGIGYQKAAGSDANLAGISLGYTINGFSAGVMYAAGKNAANQDDNILQVGAGYKMDAFSAHFNYQTSETNNVTTDGWGIAAGYDLGGGAVVKGAYNSDEEFSLGIAMSF